MPSPAQGTHPDSERNAEFQSPPAWELPPLELRILAGPRPGPRDLRVYLAGFIILFIVTMVAAPYLRERPVTDASGELRGGIPAGTELPPVWRPTYERALNGDALAMRMLGDLYCQGRDVPRDIHQGIRWYRLALAAGCVVAAKDLERLGVAPEI
jgi:hypothetical protein